MIKLFFGMIIGSVMTIYAAGGSAIADRITHNVLTLAQDSSKDPHALLLIMSVWGATAVSMVWIKKRQQRPRISQYSYLLR